MENEKKEETQASPDLSKLMEQIGATVKEQVTSTMKDMGFDKGPDVKVGAGSGKGGSHAEKLAYVKGILSEKDAAYMDMLPAEESTRFLAKAKVAYFFKHLVAFTATRDPEHLQHVKALAQGVDADGGYTVPQEFRAQLVRDLKDLPALRNLVTVLPMSTNYLEMPTLINDVKVSWGSENTSITTTTASFGQLTFTPYRLNTLIYVSRELVSDSALNVIQLLSQLFREAIMREEDRVIVNGSGTGQPKGIITEAPATVDNGNDDSTIAGNIKATPFRLGARYRSNARWLVNGKSMQAIAKLQDSTYRPLLGDLENGTGLKLAGYPVVEQNDMPINTLVFGDLAYYYLADRETMTVESTTEGAGTFEKHQVAIKVTERIDGKVAQVAAFRRITNCGFL